MGSIDLNLQGHFGLKLIDFRKFELASAITRQGFNRMCILGPSRTLLKIGSIDVDFQGHFGLSAIGYEISAEYNKLTTCMTGFNILNMQTGIKVIH